MWSASQYEAAQRAVDEMRQRAATAGVLARTTQQHDAAVRVFGWCVRIQSGLLGGVVAPEFAGWTYDRFMRAMAANHDVLALIDGEAWEPSLFTYARRFWDEVVGQTAVDVKVAAVDTAKKVSEGLPWLALGLGALAVIYATKAVR